MRENVTLECSACKNRNYRTSKNNRDRERLELSKYCRFCRKHTSHKERRR